MSYHFLRLRSLLEEIERILGRYKGHQVLALRSRLGIDGPRTTLEDAGRAAGMTRERVRQLEARFFEQFLASPAAAKLLTRIEQDGSASSEPLFLHQLPSKDRWFRRLAADSEVVRVLLTVASAGRLDFVDVPGGAALCRAGAPPWDELVRSARAAVRSLRKGSNRRSVRNALLKILAPHGASHLTEIGAVAERIRLPVGVTPYMLMQLAALDGRMKSFRGYLLGLSDWPDARRPSVTAAMASVASAVRSPVTLDWVHAELERVVGRPLRRSVIQIALQRSALRYDSERRVWTT